MNSCLSHHANLNDLKDLVKSEVLNKILAGHISLYADLPPIPIKAYFESLKRSQRQFCKQQKFQPSSILPREVGTGFEHVRKLLLVLIVIKLKL